MRRLLSILGAGLLLTACGGGDGGADPGAGPGEELQDGFVVAEGTRLPLPAFPLASDGATGWRAVLRLEPDADLRVVSEDYAGQAEQLGYRVTAVECVDRDGVGSGSPQIEESNRGESPLPGAFCQWSATDDADARRSLRFRASERDADDRDGVVLAADALTG